MNNRAFYINQLCASAKYSIKWPCSAATYFVANSRVIIAHKMVKMTVNHCGYSDALSSTFGCVFFVFPSARGRNIRLKDAPLSSPAATFPSVSSELWRLIMNEFYEWRFCWNRLFNFTEVCLWNATFGLRSERRKMYFFFFKPNNLLIENNSWMHYLICWGSLLALHMTPSFRIWILFYMSCCEIEDFLSFCKETVKNTVKRMKI